MVAEGPTPMPADPGRPTPATGEAPEAAPDGEPEASESQPPIHRRALAAFIVTVVVVVAVLAMLPVALISMASEMRGQATDSVYDLFSGKPIETGQVAAPDTAFVNVTVTQLDEASRTATLTVSGHRVCPAACPPITGTFYSLGSDSAQRRGLPPSAAVTVPGEPGSYTYTITLPINGKPQRYPFDSYTLLLGLIVSVTKPDGTEQVIESPAMVQRTVSLTIEDDVARLDMGLPEPVDPATVRSPSDPVAFLLVDRLHWERPPYLRILTVLLVILISASGIFALGLRSLQELVLGIGGIILGIWGVRSVVVQTPLPDVTLIDLVLGVVILVLLLGLSIRAARYFYLQSGVRLAGVGSRKSRVRGPRSPLAPPVA
jgi:hypothetical protein